MTNQWKFGTGNNLFVRLAAGTCIPVMECMELPNLQSRRLQRKRTKYSTVRVYWEGRAGRPAAKAITEVENNRNGASASPVSCRQHGRKAMWGKLGDPAFSTKMPGRSSVVVVMPISSVNEEACEGMQEVGEANSTDDMKDSITFIEGRRLAVCRLVPSRGGLHSPLETQGGTRI
jgi:hypothetical protein